MWKTSSDSLYPTTDPYKHSHSPLLEGLLSQSTVQPSMRYEPRHESTERHERAAWAEQTHQQPKQAELNLQGSDTFDPSSLVPQRNGNSGQSQSPRPMFGERDWHYIDLGGRVQGPFSTLEMDTWLQSGAFPAELPIATTTGIFNGFIPLLSFLEMCPGTSQPFDEFLKRWASRINQAEGTRMSREGQVREMEVQTPSQSHSDLQARPVQTPSASQSSQGQLVSQQANPPTSHPAHESIGRLVSQPAKSSIDRVQPKTQISPVPNPLLESITSTLPKHAQSDVKILPVIQVPPKEPMRHNDTTPTIELEALTFSESTSTSSQPVRLEHTPPLSPNFSQDEPEDPGPSQKPIARTQRPKGNAWTLSDLNAKFKPEFDEIQALQAKESRQRAAAAERQRQQMATAAEIAASQRAARETEKQAKPTRYNPWQPVVRDNPDLINIEAEQLAERNRAGQADHAQVQGQYAAKLAGSSQSKPAPSIDINQSRSLANTAFESGWTVIPSKAHNVQPLSTPAQANNVTATRPTSIPALDKRTSAEPSSQDKLRAWAEKSLQSLKGVDLREFIDMLLTLPCDMSSAEVIQDMVYAHSSHLNGKQFASDFLRMRMQTTNGQLANGDIQREPRDSGFQVVKKKGKGKIDPSRQVK